MEIKHLRAKNFGSFESIDLALNKQGLVWVGGDNRDTKSAANNGSGKSTLLRALCYGLYGDTIEGEKTEKIIRKGEKKVEVEVELRDEKDVWKVQRSRTIRSNYKLKLVLPNGEESKESKLAIQKRIEDLIGMDFFAFRNTVLYGQNDIVRFADPRTTDQQRKSMLFKILRTEILQDCHEITKKAKKKVEEEIERAAREMREIDIRIEEKGIRRVQQDADDFEKKRAVQLHEHERRANNYKVLAKKELKLAEQTASDEIDIESILEKKTELEYVLESCEKAAEKLKEKKKEKREIDSDFDETKHEQVALVQAKKDAQQRLKQLDGETCPLCESDLLRGAPKDIIDGLNDKLEDMRKTQKASEEFLQKLTQERKQLRIEIEKLEERTELKSRCLNEIADLREELSEYEKRQYQADQRREYHIEKAGDYLEAAKRQKEELRDAKKSPNPYVKRIDEIKEELVELEQDKREFQKFIDGKAEELAHYRFWVHGFSNQGLPSFFLDSVMPFVTSRANKYLQVLSDGDITMNFSTQKELKRSKDYRDKIDIQWSIEGLPDTYPPSGGQMKKMSIATDLALMDLVSAREGDNVNLLALDEVLDGLDEEGSQRVISLLTDLRKTKDTILVISHEPSMSDSFEKTLHVVKENGVSRMEV